MVNTTNGVDYAIRNAKCRMANFKEGVNKPSEYEPGTTVYKLVEELMVYLDVPVEKPNVTKEDEKRLTRG